MFFRHVVIALLLVLAQFGCATHPASSNAGSANPATSGLKAFSADRLGFLSTEMSDWLSKQARQGQYAANKIQPFKSYEELKPYQKALYTTMILTTFPLSEAGEKEINLKTENYLKASKRVTLATVNDAQAAVYLALSMIRDPDDTAIVEVMVGVSDWAEAQARKAEGPVAAMAKSTLWVSVSRRNFRWEDISEGEEVSYEKLGPEIEPLYRDGIRFILLAP
jgi:hypothetical protein